MPAALFLAPLEEGLRAPSSMPVFRFRRRCLAYKGRRGLALTKLTPEVAGLPSCCCVVVTGRSFSADSAVAPLERDVGTAYNARLSFPEPPFGVYGRARR